MDEFNNTRLQTEKTVVSSVILTEYGVQSFDAQFDYLLHDRLRTLLQAYQQNRGHVNQIDLKALLQKISPDNSNKFELYLINKTGVVEYTTYQKDSNLDFSHTPDFLSSLTMIRLGNEFKSDPWIRDYHDPTIYWKFGYLPTDDHEYLLEIGLRNENYTQLHNAMFSQLKAVSVQALNIPNLVSVDMYDIRHRKHTLKSNHAETSKSHTSSMISGDKLDRILNQTFDSRESSIIENPEDNQIISVQYFNLSMTQSPSGSERKYVGILVFSTEEIENTIRWHSIGFIIGTILSLVLGLIMAHILSRYISKPIEMMTEDVGIIADSSLTHMVRSTGFTETEQLRSSINLMVSSIKENIQKIEDQKKALRTELTLREKAEISLAKANKRLTNLSQITRHDILNQLTALQFYLHEIPDTTEKTGIDEYAKKAQQILEKIIMLLRFTYDYEKIGEERPVWQNIGQILNKNQQDFKDLITIIQSCDGVEILADRLIAKVFYNLLDNTIRHGVTADTVKVCFEEKPDAGYLVYLDNGIGIPDRFKQKIFDSGFGKGTGIGMAFIKDVLEADDIRIREVGFEGKGVRFEIVIPRDHYRITP
ncbi:MAG: HAMP domain-containing histidine kinase [Methanospirillum sp.]|nr:HAMP domain-containing histidine kinase [Methanospirillum sp.]